MSPKFTGWSSLLMFVLGLFVLALDIVAGDAVVAGGAGLVKLGERTAVNVTIASSACRQGLLSTDVAYAASPPLTTDATATFNSYYVSPGTAATGSAIGTLKSVVMRAADNPLLSSILNTVIPSTTTTIPTTTTSLSGAAASSLAAGEGANDEPHDIRYLDYALGIGLPGGILLSFCVLWWICDKKTPRPMHRAWPDDAYTGRGGLELRQWGTVTGGNPREEKGWRKVWGWLKR